VHAKTILEHFKYALKRHINEGVWSFAAGLVQGNKTRKFSEVTLLNPAGKTDSKVLIIRRRPPGGGLFSNVNHVLQGLEIARESNYTPVVDMENYWTSYSQMSPVNGSRNAWNYFFEPVSGLQLDKVKEYAEVKYTAGDRINPTSILGSKDLNFMLSKEKIEYLNKLFSTYIKLNKPTSALLSNLKEFLNWDSHTLGVSFRGDYVKLEPKGHARQPELDMVKASVEMKISDSQINKILISTDNDRAQKLFRDICPDMNYPKFRDDHVLRKLIPNGADLSPQAINAFGYLAEIYLLSETYAVVTSIANGPATAFIINGNKFDNPIIFNLGSY
jgi:hypothetical protein